MARAVSPWPGTLGPRGPAVLAVAILLLSGLVVALSDRPVPTGPCPTVLPRPIATASPIQHVFFVIKENHATENYFGDLPGVIGYPPTGSFPVAVGSNRTISPYPIDANSTPDLPHDHGTEVREEDGGRNDLFVAEAAADGAPDPGAAVGYYTSSEIPDYYDYARSYVLGDEFYSGILGPTLPNRLFDLGLTGTNWTTNAPPPPSAVEGPTLPGQLEQAGIPWAYYYSEPGTNLAPSYVPQFEGNACDLAHFEPVANLTAAIRGPDPPSVAYVDPSDDPLYSEHPPENVSLGEAWTADLVNQIFESPIGPSSVIFLFFDEAGGYWDPVAPPNESALGDGFRVPLLVLSPYSRLGEIDHEVLDPSSLLGFVDANFGLPPLDPRIANAPSVDGFFDFARPAAPPLLLPTPVTNLTPNVDSGPVPDGSARALAALPSERFGGGGPPVAPALTPTDDRDPRPARPSRTRASRRSRISGSGRPGRGSGHRPR